VWLREVEADRLRNLRAIRLELSGGLTLVAGRNGQGKTSLLEAVYLLGTGRSFRTRRQEELVSWENGPMRVAGRVENRVGQTRLTVTIDDQGRRLAADGGEKELVEFIGRLDVVDLTAERMKVLRGGPEERRKFLDRGVVGLSPSYLRSLGEYRRVLQQRNALLRGGGAAHSGGRATQLEAWDERLVEAGAELHQRRGEYAEALQGELEEAARVLFPAGEPPRLVYRPSPGGGEAVGDGDDAGGFQVKYARTLAQCREQDLDAGHTTRGPHRDELLVELDGVDLRRYGSAGQVRATMVALKLAKMGLLQQDRGEAPLFLIDDFDSHLDEVRAAALAGYLYEGGFQALVATSKESLADGFGVAFSKVVMHEGKVSESPADRSN
jgi:DNA replication and repair protein RecF